MVNKIIHKASEDELNIRPDYEYGHISQLSAKALTCRDKSTSSILWHKSSSVQPGICKTFFCKIIKITCDNDKNRPNWSLFIHIMRGKKRKRNKKGELLRVRRETISNE